MATMAEVFYFAEEMELYSPEGNLVAPLADYRLTIDIDHNGNWSVDLIEYPNGTPVHAGKFGHALCEIIKLSLMRPENKRHVRNIQEMVSDAKWDVRTSVKSNAHEYWWRTRYERIE